MKKKTFWVWVNLKLYRLYVDGNTVRYEGNGVFVVQEGTKLPLKSNQQAG